MYSINSWCYYSFSFLSFFLVFLAMPHSLRDLNSPTRDWTLALAVKVLSPNHWTSREFPDIVILATLQLSSSWTHKTPSWNPSHLTPNILGFIPNESEGHYYHDSCFLNSSFPSSPISSSTEMVTPDLYSCCRVEEILKEGWLCRWE